MRNSSLLAGAALGVLIASGLGAAAQAQDLGVKWKGAPELSNDDVKFKVRGRTYVDYVFQDVDRDTGVDYSTRNGRIRTARLGVEGQWNSQWAYKAELNFNGRETEWEDLILEYKPTESASIMIGNFKTVSLENVTSSRYITFMERGAFADIIDGGRTGTLAAKMNGQNWTLTAAGLFGPLNGGDVNGGTSQGEEQVGAVVRGTFAPVLTDTTQVHLGAWARYRDSADSGLYRYRARNNTNVGDRFIDTGTVVETDTAYALEGALVRGPFSVQAEYAQINADRAVGGEATAKAYYVAGSFFVTGEKRNYEAAKGEFGRVKIQNPLTAGGMGALELAARYDSVDLSDFGTAKAGEYSAWTAGANWYPFPYVRLMANYTKAENNNPLSANDVDVDTFQMRAQFDF